jgi:phosphoribosylanthranilate isomerase
MVRVKICGVTNREDAEAAVAAGANLLGFNFYPRSPRFVSPATVHAIVRELPREIATVAVVVNSSRDAVRELVEATGVGMLQFHGDEPPELCAGWPCQVIKAIRMRDDTSLAAAAGYDVDFLLADAFVAGEYGGTGQRVALDLLRRLPSGRLIVAGGLTPENVGSVLEVVRPYAVDVASGVESSPGRKDGERMRRFIANVQSA